MLKTSPLGSTGLDITALTVGGAPLGSMPSAFGYDVSVERGIATALAALQGPVRAIDTSPAYSDGESERRVGRAVASVGGLPVGYILSTKVARDSATGEFSGEQVRRGVTRSLQRLGVARVPLLYLHDPEFTPFEDVFAAGGPVDALVELKESGIAHAIGVAGGDTETMARYVGTGAFDVLLTHNRWTLVNRSADRLIDTAVSRGMGVVNAAVFGGGVLAAGVGTHPRYGYRDAPEELVSGIRRIEQICAEAGVPLAHAAVQFSTRDPRVASTIVGISRPERLEENVAAATSSLPDGLFDAIDAVMEGLASPTHIV